MRHYGAIQKVSNSGIGEASSRKRWRKMTRGRGCSQKNDFTHSQMFL